MNNSKLEEYLLILDKSLYGISISEKAEFITEIKSHILASIEKSPDKNIDEILESIGTPVSVAKKYLAERGVVQNKQKVVPIIKWLVIGFMGTLLILILFSWLLFLKVKPSFSMDGNIINVDMLNGTVKMHFNVNDEDDMTIHYSPNNIGLSDYKIISQSQTKELNISYQNGNLKITNTRGNKLIWTCLNTRVGEDVSMDESQNIVSLDLNGIGFVDCNIQIPDQLPVNIKGVMGNIELVNPISPIKTFMKYGIVQIKPSDSLDYIYSLKVINGKADYFNSASSNNKTAIPISITIENGKITH